MPFDGSLESRTQCTCTCTCAYCCFLLLFACYLSYIGVHPRVSHGPKTIPSIPHLSWKEDWTSWARTARRYGNGLGQVGPLWVLFRHKGPIWAILSSNKTTNGSLRGVWGPDVVGLMVLSRATCHPIQGFVRTFVLEILKLATPLARLLVVPCWLNARTIPRLRKTKLPEQLGEHTGVTPRMVGICFFTDHGRLIFGSGVYLTC